MINCISHIPNILVNGVNTPQDPLVIKRMCPGNSDILDGYTVSMSAGNNKHHILGHSPHSTVAPYRSSHSTILSVHLAKTVQAPCMT